MTISSILAFYRLLVDKIQHLDYSYPYVHVNFKIHEIYQSVISKSVE